MSDEIPVLVVTCPNCQRETIGPYAAGAEYFRCLNCSHLSLFAALRSMRPWPRIAEWVRAATGREVEELDRGSLIAHHEKELARLKKRRYVQR